MPPRMTNSALQLMLQQKEQEINQMKQQKEQEINQMKTEIDALKRQMQNSFWTKNK